MIEGIHRFGSSLNAHLHFHCCIRDGVFAPAPAADAAAGVLFHAASALAAAAMATVQAQVRHRVVRAILRSLGAPSTPPTIAQARGPPLWATVDAALLDSIPAADLSTPPPPPYEFDQRIAW